MEKNNHSDWPLIIGNALFWLLLGGLLLSNNNYLIAGGAILAIFIGGGIAYLGWKSSCGLRRASSIRFVSLGIGSVSILIGIALLVHYFGNGRSTPNRIREQIAQVANQKTANLDLSKMGLTTLDSNITQLSTLKYLNLSGNHLTELPPEIGQLINLEHLNLDHNQLTELPPEIGKLVNLKTLSLSENRLTSAPPVIGKLVNLDYLTLSDNQLTSLPSEIGQLSKLQTLVLFDNQLTKLPPELGELTNLTTLYLDGNQLTEFPAGLEQLTRLQTLGLNRNPLGDLPSSLVEQAQSRGLQINYTPGAKTPPQVNYALVCPAVIVVIFVAAFALDRWLDRLERQLKICGLSGRVYVIPAFARATCILVLLLIGMVDVVLFTASLNPEGSGITLAAGIGVPLLLAPLALACLYILLQNNGVVVLTEDAIILRRVWREKRLSYHEIVSVKESSLGLPPNLIVEGAHITLRIPRSVENLPELYQAIMQRLTGEHPIPTFPYRLSLTRTASFFGIGGICTLIILYLGIGLAGFWVPYLQGQPPDYGFALFLFAGISVFFLPGIFIFASEALNKQQPIEMVLTDETVRFRLPRGSWQTLPAEQLSVIELEQVKFPVSVTNFPARIWSETTTYQLILKFNTQKLIIGQDRAKQFGFQPEQLRGVFQQLYPGRIGD